MPTKKDKRSEIMEILEQLPESRVDEVMDFIEYLKMKHESTKSGVDEPSLRVQQRSLKRIWDSREEDLYEL